MSTLKFVDTHNMVAFLSKPTESEGFKQIVDFLNVHPIKYALTVNPTIYTSCIEQFWSTVKPKTVNGEVQLQALVDGKKIIITEASIRIDLQLDDEEGMDCFPNATIFEELTKMRYEKISQKLTFYKAFFSPQWKFLIHTILQSISAKTTAWNEFSSTMASVIICLATNQKFNFSKYIFESMVKNLDSVGKFLMYPRFVQVFLNKQVDGMSNHNGIYVIPSHTKKIFRNMKRVGKGFSRRETPLFPTMMVQAQEEMGEGSANPIDPHHTPTIIQPSTSQPQKKQKPRKPKREDTEVPQPSGSITNVADEVVYEEMDKSLERVVTTTTSLDAEQDRGNINKTQSKATLIEPSFIRTSSGSGPRRQDTMRDTISQTRSENVSKHFNDPLLTRVLDLENIKIAQAQEITSLKLRVKNLEKKGGSRTHKLKRLYKVGRSARIVSSDEASLGDQEDASKQGRKINDIDKDADITLVNETRGRYGDDLMFDTSVLDDEEVFAEQDMAEKEINVAEKEVSTADPVTTASEVVTTVSVEVSTASPTKTSIANELTLAQTLIEIRSAKPKAELEEKDRLVRQRKEEVNIVSWDNVQAMIDADYQMAQQMQAEEQEKLSIEDKSKLFVQLLEARKKHFAAMRAKEKRNKPSTKA
ncbi:hypothetical protein Tco_0849986 [Tanacetum coccineum]